MPQYIGLGKPEMGRTVHTWLNNEEYRRLEEMCRREGKTVYKKLREIVQAYLRGCEFGQA